MSGFVRVWPDSPGQSRTVPDSPHGDGVRVTGHALTGLGDINSDGLEDFAVKAEHGTEPLT